MRRIVMAMTVAMAAGSAQAADLPDLADLPVLRGGLREGLSMRVTRWQGFYAGGQAALGRSEMNFANSTSNIADRLLYSTVMNNEMSVSRWPIMDKATSSGSGYGAFVGYNAQWDDVVLGIEANYVHGDFGGAGSGSMSRSFTASDGYTYGVTYNGSASMRIRDMGSARLRAGYVWNAFMPYVFGGVALGQADITRSATISGVAVNASATPPFDNIPFNYSASEGQNGRLIYGYALGLGTDVKLWGGLFGRLEWEYLRFVGNIDTSVNTVRAGLGYRF